MIVNCSHIRQPSKIPSRPNIVQAAEIGWQTIGYWQNSNSLEILKCLYKHAYALGLTLLVTRLCLKLRSELLTAVDVVILRLILCVNKTNAPKPGLRVCDVWRSVTLLTSTSCSHCPAFILEIRSPMSSYTDPPRPAVLFRMCNCVNSHLCLSTFGQRGIN